MADQNTFPGAAKFRKGATAVGVAVPLLLCSVAPASAFAVDGKVEGGEYTMGWDISAQISGSTSEKSKLFVRQTGNDVFLAVVVDIDFVDNVYGVKDDAGSPTETVGSGWETKDHKMDKLISSDRLTFNLDLGAGATTFEVELVKKNCAMTSCSDLDKNTVVVGPGPGTLTDDDVATSFNYNYLQSLTESGFGDFSNKDTSESPDPLFDQPGGEVANEPNADWIQELVYEYHFLAEPGKVIGLADLSNVDIHASPKKDGATQDTGCVNTNSCDPTTPPGGTPVAEPGMLAIYGFGLAGLGYVRRRRKVS